VTTNVSAHDGATNTAEAATSEKKAMKDLPSHFETTQSRTFDKAHVKLNITVD